MKCLVTGADGLIGGFLVEYLLEAGNSVCAFEFDTNPVFDKLDGDLCRIQGNVLDKPSVAQAIRGFAPEVIFHLAAQSLPNVSWDEPELTFRVNILGTINVFEEAANLDTSPVIVVPGSSSEYGSDSSGCPIAEDGRMEPSSPYAVSKLAQDHLGRVYHEYRAMRIVRARPFYLIGPRKTGDVSSDFARRIVAIEREQSDELRVGNLDVVRDLLDVRDGVEALWCLALKGEPGEVYNICSGRGMVLKDLLEMFRRTARVPVRKRVDPSLVRKIDDPVKIGDPSRLKALGWEPSRTIERTVEDILNYWREMAP